MPVAVQMAKLQKQLTEARSEVESLGMELRTTQARQESSQALSNSVMNLWNKMHDNSEVPPSPEAVIVIAGRSRSACPHTETGDLGAVMACPVVHTPLCVAGCR
jgi:hypothetical protein